MFYAIASGSWRPGAALSPTAARGGLFRSRAEARRVAPDGPLVALAVRHDEARGTLFPQGPVASAQAPGWTCPAIRNDLDGLTPFAPIPAPLVRVVPPAETRADSGASRPIPRIHAPACGRIRPPVVASPAARARWGRAAPA